MPALVSWRRMELYQVDDHGRLFISPALENWDAVARYQIDTVIDLEGDVDTCIPTATNACLYIYFPIDDDNEQLPNMIKLRAIARLGATLIADGHRVLSHCGMGYNRSAFVAGLIMIELGMPGPEVVARLRERRPGALFNDGFASCLEALLASTVPT
jgi:protein-tyrosine phosphatase